MFDDSLNHIDPQFVGNSDEFDSHNFGDQSADILPSLHLFRDSGPFGVDNLDPALEINGTTVYPSVRYKGGDADATDIDAWTYGDNLARVAVGTPPSYNQGSPCLGDNDDSVLFKESDYYQAAAATTGDITTGDIVVELVLKANRSAGAVTVQGKLLGGAPFNGWDTYLSATGVLSLYIDSGAADARIDSAALTNNTWYHCMFFVNRDEASANGGQCYVNAIASGAGADCSAAAASLTSTANFSLGGATNGLTPTAVNLAYFAMWTQADWHQAGASGPTEWATIAKERFHKLVGTYSQRALGTAVPISFTRATVAHLDKIESGVRYMYQVGAGWPRIIHAQDSASTDTKGYLSEVATTNKFLHSTDIGNVAWTPVNAAISGTVTSPDKVTNLKGIVGSAADLQHGVTRAVTLTAAPWVVCGFAKKGAQNHCYLENTTIANGRAWFNLNTGAVGTKEAGITASGIEDWGNGIYLVYATFTGTAAAHTLGIYGADNDNDATFTGDASTVDTYAGFLQCHLGVYPRTHVTTGAAEATRNADQLLCPGLANFGGVGSNQRGALFCDVLIRNQDYATSSYLWALTDGGDFNESIRAFINASGDVIVGLSATAGGNAGNTGNGTTDLADGVIHRVGCTWETNNYVMYVDGSAEASDTTVDFPDDLDQLDIGQQQAGALQINGVISNFKIYPYPTSIEKSK
jgi:hypothetical protein